MKYFINYADKFYFESQQLELNSAKDFGFNCQSYSKNDIDNDFIEKNKIIIDSPRGAGYWLWKPYLILKKLNEIDYGEYLVYMDSGANFIKPADDLLESIDDKGILAFQLKNNKNNKWIKGDCFFAINSIDDVYKFKDDEQILASFIFFRKTDFCVNFVKKWLYYAEQKNVIMDLPNVFFPNCNEFIDHRHDQAIFSLLCYNYNITCMPDISQYGLIYDNISTDSVRINHHRNS